MSLRGYGAIRNRGLAVANILAHDSVIFLDADELVLGPDFMKTALYALGQQTRQGLPILAKSGYFFNKDGSPLASDAKAGILHISLSRQHRLTFLPVLRRDFYSS